MAGPVRALLGPTASGKSDLAVAAARAATEAGTRPVEVVALDAYTVYRGLDVASAKPAAALRREVPHHLVDVLDPSEPCTVARFRDLARAAIADVHARGAVPLLVGGSGLYWRAVVDDLAFPPTDAEVRRGIEVRWAGEAAAAHAELARLDPAAAARIAPANLRRTVRALEVIALTGRPFSSYDDAWDAYRSRYPDLEVAFLDPPSDRLRRRIDARAAAMVEAGLLDEVAELTARVPAPSRTVLAAIGVAEGLAVLAGTLERSALADAIAGRTWRYAKRQRAWFRADPRCVAEAPEAAAARVLEWATGR